MMNTTVKTAVAAFLSLSVMESAAKVTLPQIYTDNMVVQQKWKAPFHGTASPDAVVRIGAGWLKDPVSVNAGPDGRWDVVLPTPKGGKGGFEVTFTDTADGSEVTLHNVTVGEVWLCSGQSNMEMPVAGWGKVLNYEQEIAGAVYPHIRLLQVKRHTDMVPQENTEVTGGGWQVCSPQSVEEFSSIAYFFARHLWQELDVPVGVIDCTWGGLVILPLPKLKGSRVLWRISRGSVLPTAQSARITKNCWSDTKGVNAVATVNSAAYAITMVSQAQLTGTHFIPQNSIMPCSDH